MPAGSEIARLLPGADFHDCYGLALPAGDTRSALEIYLQVVARTPAWVNTLMALRNRIVGLVGLKNLGHLGAVQARKAAADYRVGDRVGIFSLLYLSEAEIVLGDSDKHLDVHVAVLKPAGPAAVAVGTVVHIHNRLGRLYMFFVGPVHKLIAPAVLRRAA